MEPSEGRSADIQRQRVGLDQHYTGDQRGKKSVSSLRVAGLTRVGSDYLPGFVGPRLTRVQRDEQECDRQGEEQILRAICEEQRRGDSNIKTKRQNWNCQAFQPEQYKCRYR